MPRFELSYLRNFSGITPEQDILLQWFYSQFDRLPVGGGNRHIANVEPLHFIGASAGSEFLTYAATKLYIAYKLGFSYSTTIGAAACIATLYNEANAAMYYCQNNDVLYDTGAAAARYSGNTYYEYNLYFSRVVLAVYANLTFTGYRITLD